MTNSLFTFCHVSQIKGVMGPWCSRRKFLFQNFDSNEPGNIFCFSSWSTIFICLPKYLTSTAQGNSGISLCVVTLLGNAMSHTLVRVILESLKWGLYWSTWLAIHSSAWPEVYDTHAEVIHLTWLALLYIGTSDMNVCTYWDIQLKDLLPHRSGNILRRITAETSAWWKNTGEMLHRTWQEFIVYMTSGTALFSPPFDVLYMYVSSWINVISFPLLALVEQWVPTQRLPSGQVPSHKHSLLKCFCALSDLFLLS